jgi:hypothetical protein
MEYKEGYQTGNQRANNFVIVIVTIKQALMTPSKTVFNDFLPKDKYSRMTLQYYHYHKKGCK